MWIVTTHAVCRREWLISMRFLQVYTLHIMAIDAKRRHRLGEVIIELGLADLTRLMCGMAGVAAHIESRMPAAFLGDVYTDSVATQAEVFFLIS